MCKIQKYIQYITDIQITVVLKFHGAGFQEENIIKGSLSGDQGKAVETKVEKHYSNLTQEFSETSQS